jgi:hypothetical protein
VVRFAARAVAQGLGQSPALLTMVVLNLGMIAAAAWYLEAVAGFQHAERLESLRLIGACMAGH